MTRILYFIIPLFLMSCGGKEVYNDLKQQNLQGEIKQVRMSSYSVIEKFNQVEKKARTSERENTLTIFNNKGNQVEKTFFSTTDKAMRNYVYRYDTKGNRALVNEFKENGTLKTRYIYSYDPETNEVVIYSFIVHGAFVLKDIRFYNDKQLLLEEEIYNKKGELEQKQINTYNDRDLCIETNIYNSDGELNLKYSYAYDDKGNMVERKKYAKEGKTLANHTYIYTLDEKDNWIQRIEYLNGKAIYLTDREITYGEGEKELREPISEMDTAPENKTNVTNTEVKNDWTTQELKGAIKTLRVKTYDAKNRKQKDKMQNTLSVFTQKGYLTKIVYYNKDNIYSYEKKFAYEYDDKGNRTEGKMFFNDGDYLLTTYDDKGYITGGHLYQNKTQFELKAVYNDDGNLIEYYLQDTEILYKYDKNNNVIEENHKNDKENWDILYNRAKNGSITEEQIYRKGILDEKYTFIYTFGEKGNWVERTQYKNRTPIEITERVIEYY